MPITISVRGIGTVVGAGIATAALLNAVGPSQSLPAPRTTAAAALPAIVLKEMPAFPLPSHVESKQIAAGGYTFQQLFAAGEALFHTAFNGLDGVGSAVRKDGTKVTRFAPPGPKGPGSQACGECHAVPFGSSAGLAHSSVGREKKGRIEVNVRSVTSLFGDGILQLLAQEMTEDLQAIRDAA